MKSYGIAYESIVSHWPLFVTGLFCLAGFVFVALLIVASRLISSDVQNANLQKGERLIEAYRAHHGLYPPDLEALQPDYVNTLFEISGQRDLPQYRVLNDGADYELCDGRNSCVSSAKAPKFNLSESDIIGTWVQPWQEPGCPSDNPALECVENDEFKLVFSMEGGKKVYKSFLHHKAFDQNCTWEVTERIISVKCPDHDPIFGPYKYLILVTSHEVNSAELRSDDIIHDRFTRTH